MLPFSFHDEEHNFHEVFAVRVNQIKIAHTYDFDYVSGVSFNFHLRRDEFLEPWVSEH